MRVRRAAELATAIVALTSLGTRVHAQDGDLTLPPRLEDSAPFAARLEPQPPDRIETLEEVLVVGDDEWRLPDLGSTWRAEQAAEPATARIEADMLPLYDPEDPTHERTDWFLVNEEIRRVGFIELFRIRFGERNEE